MREHRASRTHETTMAKKPKKTDGDEAPASPEGEAPKSKKKLVIMAAAGLLVLGGGGAGAYVFLGKKAATEPKVEVKKPVAFVEVKEMTVNLANEPNQEKPRFLKLKVALEVKDQKLAADIQPLMPRVEDAFQVFVRELRPTDLEGSVGVYRLREELLRRVNVAVYPAKVDAVLFKDVVIQ